MAIRVSNGFDVRSKNPIDVRILLTKAEMLAINEKLMPQNYFCICKDDGRLYIYNSTFAPSAELGRFRSYEEIMNISTAINKALEDPTTKSAIEQAIAGTIPGAMANVMSTEEGAQKIVEAMFDSEHFETTIDNKIDLKLEVIQAIGNVD